MKRQNDDCLILSDLQENFDASSIDAVSSPATPSHKTIVVSLQPTEEAKPAEVPSTIFPLTTRVILTLVILSLGIFLVAIGLFFLFSNHFENEVISRLVAQPFTENNDFVYFHMHNKMKVLFVRPNTMLNDTYICDLTSAIRRSRIRD